MRLVVFDLDGTLLYTLVDLTNAVNIGLSHAGLATIDERRMRDIIGRGAEYMVSQACGDVDEAVYREVFEVYSAHYHEHFADNTSVYAGVTDILDYLASRGVAVGVFSNKNDRAVKLLCEKHFGSRVQWAIGRQRGGASKPDPFGLLDIMQQCGVDASQTVYVGDSTVDIHTAGNAGVRCACLDWGYNDHDKLVACGAQHIASSAQQLIDILSDM